MIETLYDSPIGTLYIGTEEGALRRLSFSPLGCEVGETDVARKVISQLDEYFAGERKEFDLPLRMEGTEFQKRCWEVLMTIGYGETMTYGEEAEAVGKVNAQRAVGMANHRNPIAIVVPCHRVVAKGGKIGGYGGGLKAKEYLLTLEMMGNMK